MPSSCVCVSVCVSVTLRYCIKTAKRRITQTTPHDSPMTLVFLCQRSWRNSNGITPYGGDKCRCGGLKLVTFRRKTRYNSKTVQDRRIVSIKVIRYTILALCIFSYDHDPCETSEAIEMRCLGSDLGGSFMGFVSIY